MTPKEQAYILVRVMQITSSKLSDYSFINLPTAKLHALMAVNLIGDLKKTYWQEVKKEIDKI